MSNARRWRLALAAAIGVLPIAPIPSVADEDVYVIDHWPADLDTIPCSAWHKTSDGTWALVSGSIKVGASVLSHVGFKGDTEAGLIERNCGSK